MMFEGMPWPLMIPIAMIALTLGVIASRKEIKVNKQSKGSTKKKS